MLSTVIAMPALSESEHGNRSKEGPNTPIGNVARVVLAPRVLAPPAPGGAELPGTRYAAARPQRAGAAAAVGDLAIPMRLLLDSRSWMCRGRLTS